MPDSGGTATYPFNLRPLPECPEPLPEFRHGHAGLWMDKWGPDRTFAREGRDTKDEWPGQETKQAWIKGLASKSWGDKDKLERACASLRTLASARSGLVLTLEAVEPLVVGIGLPNPLENGLIWHHRFAAPYIPGSSLKGMTRAWARDWLEMGDDNADVRLVFGPPRLKRDERTAEFAGAVCFLDAIPTAPVRLQAEVMTPHYSPYYGEAADAEPALWPGDWFSPVPIGYLAIAPGARFVTVLLPRIKGRHDALLADVADWLRDGAAFIGLGAKTSRGMGRLDVVGEG